ncbi:MAG: ATP-binding protein, partial [Chthoniobacteraceae bacterium]
EDITDRKQRELERIEWANRYDAAIRASGQVVFDWDTVADKITYWGNNEPLLGPAVDAIEGGIDRLREIIHPEDLPAFDLQVENVLLTREPFQHEFRIIKSDSTESIVKAQGRFFLDRHGRLGRMVGFLSDVTVERTSERKVQLANEILERRVADRTAALEQANRELAVAARRQEAVARVGQQALQGMPLSRLMAETVSVVREMLASDFTYLHEFNEEDSTFRCMAHSGWASVGSIDVLAAGTNSQSLATLTAVGVLITPDFDIEPRFVLPEAVREAGAKSALSVPIKTGRRSLGVLATFSRTRREYSRADADFIQTIANGITVAIERHEAEEEIRSAQAAAELANRAKTEFMSRMSHELRTPLNAVLGFSQLLEMEEHTDRQKESITLISRAGRNLLDLINEVLDIARLDSGRVQFNVETVDVMELFRNVVTASSAVASARKIELRIAEAAGEEPFLSVDRERFKQVLLNLVSNAVKYNHDGGSVTLAVARADGGMWRISVTDTGIGIPQEKVSRLFVPFERLGTREGGTEGGTGLGLALCQRLVRAFGGRIGVASTPGLGSTFWIELLAAEVAPKPVVAPAVLDEPSPAAAPAPAAHKVLYVEDDATNYYLLERILASRKDIKLVSALRGDRGLELIREDPPELILLDMNLPDMTGEQLLVALRKTQPEKNIRVIAVTGDVLGNREKELAALGVIDVLFKPYKVAEITGVLDRVFNPKA